MIHPPPWDYFFVPSFYITTFLSASPFLSHTFFLWPRGSPWGWGQNNLKDALFTYAWYPLLKTNTSWVCKGIELFIWLLLIKASARFFHRFIFSNVRFLQGYVFPELRLRLFEIAQVWAYLFRKSKVLYISGSRVRYLVSSPGPVQLYKISFLVNMLIKAVDKIITCHIEVTIVDFSSVMNIIHVRYKDNHLQNYQTINL